MKSLKAWKFAKNLTKDAYYSHNLDTLSIFYFNKRYNVGDALSPYIFEKLTHKKIYLSKHQRCRHLLGLGSILHFANENSLIWGSGLISESAPPKNWPLAANIYAVRGRKTAEKISEVYPNLKRVDGNINVPLGDPAILMPDLYMPKPTPETRKVGLVLNIAEVNLVKACKTLSRSSKIFLIDVRQPIESFIDNICSCELVISSSLHGLILSDVYSINNKWLEITDQIIGGKFKFQDYYSTTNAPYESPIKLSSLAEIENKLDLFVSTASIKSFIESKHTLLSALGKSMYHV